MKTKIETAREEVEAIFKATVSSCEEERDFALRVIFYDLVDIARPLQVDAARYNHQPRLFKLSRLYPVVIFENAAAASKRPSFGQTRHARADGTGLGEDMFHIDRWLEPDGSAKSYASILYKPNYRAPRQAKTLYLKPRSLPDAATHVLSSLDLAPNDPARLALQKIVNGTYDFGFTTTGNISHYDRESIIKCPERLVSALFNKVPAKDKLAFEWKTAEKVAVMHTNVEPTEDNCVLHGREESNDWENNINGILFMP
ncbi:MAG: hypothetical protein GC137_02370 [Alphaproteobacteria bacterium]|nr:hypothetical protein [Alphaproteobacteria bacterium]